LSPDATRYLPLALSVLTLRASLISDVTAFLTRSSVADRDLPDRLPEASVNPVPVRIAFEQFGLPAYLV
jgi:hypothetical protein